jgi:DNA-binding response OmpR family regulator
MLIGVLEDNVSQLELVSCWLKLGGHRVRPFTQGEHLIASLTYERLDALMLDWMVDDASGLDVLRRVRAVSASLPVLFCTARNREEDIVQALREGADDFLAKPIRCPELLARIDSITRQARQRMLVSDLVHIEEFQLDYGDRTLKRDGQPIELSAKEFELAVLFLRNIGRALSREYISAAVFAGLSPKSRSLDTHVGRLRLKLALHQRNGWALAAVYSKGYRLDKRRGGDKRGNHSASLSYRNP